MTRQKQQHLCRQNFYFAMIFLLPAKGIAMRACKHYLDAINSFELQLKWIEERIAHIAQLISPHRKYVDNLKDKIRTVLNLIDANYNQDSEWVILTNKRTLTREEERNLIGLKYCKIRYHYEETANVLKAEWKRYNQPKPRKTLLRRSSLLRIEEEAKVRANFKDFLAYTLHDMSRMNIDLCPIINDIPEPTLNEQANLLFKQPPIFIPLIAASPQTQLLINSTLAKPTPLKVTFQFSNKTLKTGIGDEEEKESFFPYG